MLFLATTYQINIPGVDLDDVNSLSNPNNDFINALNTALGGSSSDQIYEVSFADDENGGINVVYTISDDLNSTVNSSGFGDSLETSIRNEPGLEPLFSNVTTFFFFYNLVKMNSKNNYNASWCGRNLEFGY